MGGPRVGSFSPKIIHKHAREGGAGMGARAPRPTPQPPTASKNGPRSPGSRADGKIPGRGRETPQRAV